jgi:hypothetical protein
MIKPIELIDLYCGCGQMVSHSLPNSEHYCRSCDRWLIFKNGLLISSMTMGKWRSGA